MNNVSLIGRLTADPELKTSQSGKEYTRFSIAVDRTYQKQGEERQVDFINIVAWGKTAEFICNYFSKGKRIALTGSILTGSYTDDNGNKRYTFDVIANNVEFCESKNSEPQSEDNASAPKARTSPPQKRQSKPKEQESFAEVDDDDLPF